MGGGLGGGEGLAETGRGPGSGGPPGLSQGGPGNGNAARAQQQPATTRAPQEAATFTEAFTQDTGGRAATAPETLVMPKAAPEPQLPPGQAKKTMERPAFREGSNAPTAAETADVPEGFTANDAETTTTTRGRTQTQPETRQAKGPETRQSPERSEFGFTPGTGTRVAMRASQVKVPVRPVKDLVPPGLDKLANMEAVAKRFGSDLALLQQQVRPSDVPSRERALRAWAFFTAYAEAAAGKDGLKQGLELFDKSLKKEGFGELRDARTGKDAIKIALWVLSAPTPEEALARALEADIEPMVALEILLSEAAKTLDGKGKKDEAGKGELAQKPEAGKGQEAATPKGEKAEAKSADAFAKPDSPKDPKELSAKADAKSPETRTSNPKQQQEVKPQETARRPEDARISQPKQQQASGSMDNAFGPERAPLERAEGQNEQLRVSPQVMQSPQPVLVPPQPDIIRKRQMDEESLIGRFEDALKKVDKGMRLGSNMLWNALHQLRKGPGDSAIEKEKWNQLAFAAVLAFVGLMLLVILVVSL